MDKFFSINNKKGQIWSLDLIVAGVIFFMGIIILFFYAINFSSGTEDKLETLFYEGSLVSELILSEESFGILTDNRVNQTKLDSFDGLSDVQKRNTLGVSNNFYFSMEDMEILGFSKNYVGIINDSSVDDLVHTTRVTIYKNKPVKFELFTWS